jgi:hypothetical protein
MQEQAAVEDPAPLTPDQVTGADAVYFNVVQTIVRRFIASRGGDPSSPEAQSSPEVQRVKAGLFSVYPDFQRLYAELFIKHVGAEHAPAVLQELRRKPLQRYLYARSVMTGELNKGLAELRDRMGEMEP